jgi:hypothetical protein
MAAVSEAKNAGRDLSHLSGRGAPERGEGDGVLSPATSRELQSLRAYTRRGGTILEDLITEGELALEGHWS